MSSYGVKVGAGVVGARQHTLQPVVTGASVLGIKCADGVVLAADTLGSYGSMARYRDLRRMVKVSENLVLGASGEYSDFQAISELLDDITTEDIVEEDGCALSPVAIHEFLTRVMYNRRTKGDPLWNTLVLGGMHNGASFLGLVDMLGSSFTDNTVASGFGLHLAQPILRKEWRDDLTVAEGKAILESCMKVLFYRDGRTINRVQFTTITAAGGVQIAEPVELETEWGYAAFREPGGASTGSW